MAPAPMPVAALARAHVEADQPRVTAGGAIPRRVRTRPHLRFPSRRSPPAPCSRPHAEGSSLTCQRYSRALGLTAGPVGRPAARHVHSAPSQCPVNPPPRSGQSSAPPIGPPPDRRRQRRGLARAGQGWQLLTSDRPCIPPRTADLPIRPCHPPVAVATLWSRPAAPQARPERRGGIAHVPGTRRTCGRGGEYWPCEEPAGQAPAQAWRGRTCTRRRGRDGASRRAAGACRLVVLRHGESEWNASNRFAGWVNVALTEDAANGKRPAPAQLLAGHGLLPDFAHTSVQRRAIRTADLCRWPNATGTGSVSGGRGGSIRTTTVRCRAGTRRRSQPRSWRAAVHGLAPFLRRAAAAAAGRQPEHSQFADPRHAGAAARGPAAAPSR